MAKLNHENTFQSLAYGLDVRVFAANKTFDPSILSET